METAAEYEALLAGCGAGVLVLDEQGAIERANATAREMLGGGCLVGRNALEAIPSAELARAFSRVVEERDPHAEVRVSDTAGPTLSVSLQPVAGGRSRRFLLVARDITELRRLERIRRDFVANVSHELRTPLASIRAMAETLQDGAMDDPAVATRFLRTIIDETQRLTRISEDLLVLSNAESGVPPKAIFSLSELILEVVRRHQPQAERVGVALTADVPPGLRVEANHDQIEQVVVNLVDNALKYTGAGGRAHVTAERTEAGVAVHVEDTGIGIMAQDLPRIFERFYRVDKARSRQSGGTGLGLAIVRHIVESHGGQVTVESEYGRGSTFTFVLPG